MSAGATEIIGGAPVVVFDLASLRFVRSGRGLALCSRSGEQLAHVREVPADLRQAAALILTEAAARGRVWRDGKACRIGLYDPHTGDVELGAYPKSITLRGEGALALDPDGTVGEWDDGDLLVGDALLAPVAVDDGELVARLLAGRS